MSDPAPVVGTEYDGPVYVGPEGDEPELVDADVDPWVVPAAGEREERPKWVDLFGIDPTFDEPAPSVVHPEPAEEQAQWWARHAVEHPDCCEGMYPHDEHIPAAGPAYRFASGAEAAAWLLSDDPEPPAGAVVHPEPGDRAQWRMMLASVLASRRLSTGEFDVICTACANFETIRVAAAVAAVQADLLAKIEAATRQTFSAGLNGGYNDGVRAAAALVRGPAAAVRSATKETKD